MGTPLESTKYESNSGTVHLIRLNSDTVAVAGTPPTGDIDSDISCIVSKSNRRSGLGARRVTGSRTVGTAPDAFIEYRSIPVLTPAAFDSAAFALGATFDVDGDTFTIISRTPENAD